MADDFLAGLLGNQNRARVVRLFALNQAETFTATQVAKRTGIGKGPVTREVRVLEQLGIVKKTKFTIHVGRAERTVAGKQKEEAWALDQETQHAVALSRFVHEVSPMPHKAIVEALKRSGRLATVVLSGSFVGDPTRPVDLIVAIDSVNEERLDSSIRALEPKLGREIRYATFSTPEFRYRLTIQDRLIRDTLDYPHIVLVDKMRLL